MCTHTEGTECVCVQTEGTECICLNTAGTECVCMQTEGTECVCVQTEGTECLCVQTEGTECVCVQTEGTECIRIQRELSLYVYRNSCSNEGSHFVSLVRWVVVDPYFLLWFVVRSRRFTETRAHTHKHGTAQQNIHAPLRRLSHHFLILNESLSPCVQFLGSFAK